MLLNDSACEPMASVYVVKITSQPFNAISQNNELFVNGIELNREFDEVSLKRVCF
jgi:hypothetical protein